MNRIRTKDMTLIALMAALICIAGPLTIPFGPIPLTLANLAIYLTGAVLGTKKGLAAVALYILLGCAGLPVFSGFTGGLQKLLGVTGGFLLGDLPCVAIVGLAVREGEAAPARRWKQPLCMMLGTAVLYALGTIWFIIYKTRLMQVPTGLGEALAACVIPFLPADALKIAAACLLALPIRRALYRG